MRDDCLEERKVNFRRRPSHASTRVGTWWRVAARTVRSRRLLQLIQPSMSSLAGALEEPLHHHHQLASDVDMAPPEDSVPQPGLDAGTAPQDEEMGDLFGEEDDVDYVKHEQAQSVPAALSAPDTKSPTPSSPLPDGLSSPDRRQRQALEYEEEEEPNELVEHRLEAAVAIPNVPVPKSSDDQHWVIRMPNFVKVDSKPFHPDTYIGPEHEDTNLLQGSRERDMGIKLTVENTVRWRWVKDQESHDVCDVSRISVSRVQLTHYPLPLPSGGSPTLVLFAGRTAL
ncbi:hypothetical protein EVG20_g8809 [Dentipellis fragilis]|uniref:Uncharacterized protein n=1 Tax=Dentipellis fragilis TaxID=205917 RepID=A0A4Y9Y5P2_9AGAM|nr:hypothetical protein EVG20_g8809 [Dentipellis fragilis]